jgi:hypothetical protein
MADETGTELVALRASLMEGKFFASKEAEVIRDYREKVEAKIKKKELKQVAPFDEETLNGLVEAGIDKHTLVAAQLIPLISIAWSDDSMEENEMMAILRAARAHGIEEETEEYRLLEHWLRVQPSAELFETWKGFIAGYAKTYDVSALEEKIYRLSVNLAESAGGFLRIMAISNSEQEVLNEIKSAFAKK